MDLRVIESCLSHNERQTFEEAYVANETLQQISSAVVIFAHRGFASLVLIEHHSQTSRRFRGIA